MLLLIGRKAGSQPFRTDLEFNIWFQFHFGKYESGFEIFGFENQKFRF